jgi:hypothetical protein
MEIKIPNKIEFLDCFLNPLSKLSDSATLKINDNKITSITSNNDNTVILFTKFDLESSTSSEVSLHIPDCKKLIKLLTCTDENSVTLKLDKNYLTFSNSDLKFKYHLLEDGILSSPKVNVDKIEKIEFNTTFKLTKLSLNILLKASTIAMDVSKLYLYTDNTTVFGDFTDNSRHNVDSLAVKIANEFTGDQITQVPINFDIIRLIISKTNDISVKYCSKLGVFLFTVEDKLFTSKYIVTALVN